MIDETREPMAAEQEAALSEWFKVLDRIAALGRERRLKREAQQAAAAAAGEERE